MLIYFPEKLKKREKRSYIINVRRNKPTRRFLWNPRSISGIAEDADKPKSIAPDQTDNPGRRKRLKACLPTTTDCPR